MVVSEDAFVTMIIARRGERCPPPAGSVNGDGIVAARAEEAITREGA
jgi:hypothetical protein